MKNYVEKSRRFEHRDEVTFPVTKVRNTESTLPKFAHKIVAGGTVVNYCSDNYSLLPMDKVLDRVEKQFGEVNYDVRYNSENGCKFLVDYRFNDPLEITPKDVLYPKLTLLHSYSGDTPFSFEYGVFRQLCSNGAGIFLSKNKVTLRHSKRVLSIGDVTTLAKEAMDFLGFWKKGARPIILNLATRTVDWTTFEEAAQEITKELQMTRVAELVVERALLEHRRYNLKATPWLLYNGINYQLNHNHKELASVGETTRRAKDQQALRAVTAYFN